MNAIALFDTSARKTRQMVTVHGWDSKLLCVEWADGKISWSPRYIFEHGYDQFQCAS